MAPAPAPGLSRAEQGTAGKICPAPRLDGVNEPRRDDIPGWGRGAAWTDPGAPSVGRTLATSLAELGIERAFGVLGGGIAPFAAGLAASPIRFLHTRHEAGAVFAAIEAHFATGRPALAVVTTGPGLFNALGGVMAARADGARLLLVSGATARTLVGRGAVQETSAHHLPGGLGQAGAMFHAAWQPESVDELPAIVSALAQGWGRPGGFVAHLALPLTLQTQLVGPDTQLTPPRWHQALPEPDPRVLDLVLDRLGGRAVVWVGHGARAAGPELATFVRAAQLPVLTTPRAKGVFPERDPLHLGVSGTGSSAGVDSFLAARPLDGALVLGTRLGEVSSLLSPRVVPRAGWVHVDLDPTAFAAAFPGTAGLGVVADCGRFLAALHVRATATGWYRRAHHPPMLLEAEPTAPSPRPRRRRRPGVSDARGAGAGRRRLRCGGDERGRQRLQLVQPRPALRQPRALPHQRGLGLDGALQRRRHRRRRRRRPPGRGRGRRRRDVDEQRDQHRGRVRPARGVDRPQ